MDEINKIRKAYSNGESKNALAKKFNRSWDTINRIVEATHEELVNRGKRKSRKRSVITEEVIKEIKCYLEEEKKKNVRRKQRYTAHVIYRELKEKGIYKGQLRQLQTAVKEIRDRLSQTKEASYLPLEFALGSMLQVDHGEADIEVAGIRYSGYLFVASVPGYTLRYCQWYPKKASEFWGAFHERMFLFFGGTFSEITYDNDKVLISKITGSKKEQTTFSIFLEEHYNFTSRFCNPASGNEKGAVENAVGFCRRNYLSGYRKFSSFDEVNIYLEECCNKEIETGTHYKSNEALSDLFVQLQECLNPLPPKKLWGKKSQCRVNSYQLVSVSGKEYSVPEKYVGTFVEVLKTAFTIHIFKENEEIAQHPRIYEKSSSLLLEHYLDQLAVKPLALWDCQAVQRHDFDPDLLKVWEYLSTRYSQKESNREFIRILLLGRKYGKEVLKMAASLSLEYNAVSSDAVENIIHQLNSKQKRPEIEKMQDLLSDKNYPKWEMDISKYGKLCKEIS